MNHETIDALGAPSQHPMPALTPDAETWRLQIDGKVERPIQVALGDLRALPRMEQQGSFTCERGWEEGRLHWQGASLAALLELACPLPEATALYAYAGDFRSLVPLEAVPQAILVDQVDGHALTAERGAPCRLVVHSAACQLSMKWLERLELVRSAPEEPVGPRRPLD
jgi:DMSO/TMAO reductase YedYZ molybdopterin-dependent catalytic subunit